MPNFKAGDKFRIEIEGRVFDLDHLNDVTLYAPGRSGNLIPLRVVGMDLSDAVKIGQPIKVGDVLTIDSPAPDVCIAVVSPYGVIAVSGLSTPDRFLAVGGKGIRIDWPELIRKWGTATVIYIHPVNP
jgi:hypothetical protein